MPVYQKLLLSTGGGIISDQQQAEQVENTATVLIGLGGTGVHCIRTIKTQVYNRLKPDDPEAVSPTYSHIRFIGVDTTRNSGSGALEEDSAETATRANSILSLSDTELFYIGKDDLAQLRQGHIESRKEFSWLSYEDIGRLRVSSAGAGGIRQVGRLMLMDCSKDFMDKVLSTINDAKRGLQEPTVNIHIFSGLSGGTGSGCFLDVCYMVRNIIETQGINNCKLFGYFFLPDVNLSNVPMAQSRVREYIPKNGYAAMQELDYCMNIEKNGGRFEQVYQGHKTVRWSVAPVDMCHLISSTDSVGNVIPDAYNYAMNATAEYVMDFLTQSDSFSLYENHANFIQMVSQADQSKTMGANMAYCVIGASCASIPLREINTYLASELFDKFSSICSNVPTRADIEKFTVSALARDKQNISGLYDSLYSRMREQAGDDYEQYHDDWRYVMEYGNSDFVTFYTDQTASKLNRVEVNAKSMVSADNERSLIGCITSGLESILRDINRGPMYAYGMLSAAQSHNLLNIIDGLIAENTAKWEQEGAQTDLRTRDYEKAKDDFDKRRRRSLLDTDQKRFNDYEYYLMLLEQHKLYMEVYYRFDSVLKEFRSQLRDIAVSYYLKLSRVVSNLIDTFRENKMALASENAIRTSNTFVTPMMTISEIKGALDEEIKNIDIPNMLEAFMSQLIENPDVWMAERESKIVRFVKNFFVEVAFADFAHRTITEYLRDKYEARSGENVSDEQLKEYVYNDWMRPLISRANPLFPFNTNIWRVGFTDKIAFISYPISSAPIKAAAEDANVNLNWNIKGSALTDRITVICCACALPLSAYSNCATYGEMYFSSVQTSGRHLYEGKPVQGTPFSDWRHLSSITPKSKIIIEDIHSEDFLKMLSETEKLYKKSREYGVIDEDSYICEPDVTEMQKMSLICNEAESTLNNANSSSDVETITQTLELLKVHRDISMIKSDVHMANDGHRGSEDETEKIREDYFTSSPVFQIKANSIISEIEALSLRAYKLIQALEEKKTRLRSDSDALNDYCDALFTGVLELNGFVITYNRNQFGVITTFELCKRDKAEYPYCSIPIYQGFISYKKLGDDVKTEIQNSVSELYNTASSKINESGNKLLSVLSDDRVMAWAQLATTMENKAEILDFITKLKQRFEIFRLENGLGK